ncbi:MAG: hypothetical protein LM582_04160 [Desulfurococcaceae archaeon]|nr:hypothetical protein [Desulfurococcaceae archaeon]
MSEKTFDRLYKLIEYLLVNEEVLAEEILRGAVDTNAISAMLSSWCLSNIQEKVYSDICSKSFNIIDEAARSIFNYTILKQIEGRVKLGNDALSRLLNLLSSLADVFKKLIRYSLIVQEEKVLCKIKKPTTISSEKVVEKGYVALLPLDLAIVLTVLGYVEPIVAQYAPT